MFFKEKCASLKAYFTSQAPNSLHLFCLFSNIKIQDFKNALMVPKRQFSRSTNHTFRFCLYGNVKSVHTVFHLTSPTKPKPRRREAGIYFGCVLSDLPQAGLHQNRNGVCSAHAAEGSQLKHTASGTGKMISGKQVLLEQTGNSTLDVKLVFTHLKPNPIQQNYSLQTSV